MLKTVDILSLAHSNCEPAPLINTLVMIEITLELPSTPQDPSLVLNPSA